MIWTLKRKLGQQQKAVLGPLIYKRHSRLNQSIYKSFILPFFFFGSLYIMVHTDSAKTERLFYKGSNAATFCDLALIL